MNTLYKKDIISIPELTLDEINQIINKAQQLKKEPQPKNLTGKVIASCFFEPSTRTRLSFESAIQHLGGTVIGFDSSENTSHSQKGETLSDSIQIITSYADALVIRHPNEGAARLAAKYSKIPVINAGDGSNQHPSQTLLDLYTIMETQSQIDKLHIAFVGDLKYGRTVHSLVQALAKYSEVNCHFVAPKVLAFPDYISKELKDSSIIFHQHESLTDIIPILDILYMTRVQKERLDPSEYAHIKASFVLTESMLHDAKDNLRILHPLPRIDEIETNVDSTPYAYYFEQAQNGLYTRQALLSLILNQQG